MASVSVVVNSMNSVATIEHAVASAMKVGDEVIVLDMESTDGTGEIAAKHGARVVRIKPEQMVEVTRTRAISEAEGDWILILDGDELVPPQLASELLAIVERNEVDAVRVPFENHLFGKHLRYGSSGPRHDRHWRFFRRGSISFHERIHTEPTPVSGCRRLELSPTQGMSIIHFNYEDTGHFIQKLDRYTLLEAELLPSRSLMPAMVSAVWSAFREIGIRVVLRQGFRDGWRGLHLAMLMAFYRYLIVARRYELDQNGRADDVREAYDRYARAVRGEDHN